MTCSGDKGLQQGCALIRISDDCPYSHVALGPRAQACRSSKGKKLVPLTPGIWQKEWSMRVAYVQLQKMSSKNCRSCPIVNDYYLCGPGTTMRASPHYFSFHGRHFACSSAGPIKVTGQSRRYSKSCPQSQSAAALRVALSAMHCCRPLPHSSPPGSCDCNRASI